jgi:hypothetical protein
MQDHDAFVDRAVFPRPPSGGAASALAATLRWASPRVAHLDCRVFPAPLSGTDPGRCPVLPGCRRKAGP